MPEWLPGSIVVLLMALTGLIWRAHERRDDERFKDIWDQIGRDSSSGMRGNVHDSRNTVLIHDDAIDGIRERLDRLEQEDR